MLGLMDDIIWLKYIYLLSVTILKFKNFAASREMVY